MLRTNFLLIVLLLFSAGLAHAQTPGQTPGQDTQHFYAGISAGLFDGLTTSWLMGTHGGWVGPARPLGQIGGMSPEVSFSLQYINKIHLERIRHMPDAIAHDAVFASVVAGPRFGEQLGFRTLIGLGVAAGRIQINCSATPGQASGPDWILFARTDDDSKPGAVAAVTTGVDPLCGKNDRRFPFVAEIGPDLRLGRARITLPVVITRFGDRDTRSQFSLRLGIDFRFGGS
jgi:hypothetical protein